MKLGTENRKELILAGVLGAVLVFILIYEFMPSSSTSASSVPVTTPTTGPVLPTNNGRPVPRHGSRITSAKKSAPQQNLDPTLHLSQLATSEQIKYEGTGRNIFVAQADTDIPKPHGNGTTDQTDEARIYTPPPVTQTPIPLKFFGFASQPGEPKRIFLSKGDDVFIAGEGEIIDRRYKVVRISPTAVEIQDVVGSGPPQSIPLTQG